MWDRLVFIARFLEVVEVTLRFMLFKGSINRALNYYYRHSTLDTETHGSRAVDEAPSTPQGNPKVSIIILTLEGAPLLNALFTSFLEQNTWTDLEILVVNHGCDNETQNCLKDWSKLLPIQEIRLFKNYSFSFSCNRAAEIATGDVLIFLNNDVVLEDDFVPRMCAALELKGGLVGMKLYHMTKDGMRGSHHHIGVRFRWNILQCWTPPYNATPSHIDSDYERKPTQMPAVTAAILGCRRGEFMNIGGFHEGYVYAYEDVDLCLKYRIGNKAPVISLNDVSALHGEGETRSKRVPSPRRKAWHHRNSTMLRQRFGPRLRRDLYASIFDGDRVGCGRLAIVGVAREQGENAPSVHEMGLHNSFSLSKNEPAPTISGYNLFGLDLFVSQNSAFDMKFARHVHPAMISMACILSDDPRWSEGLCDNFDVLTAPTQSLATVLQDRLGRPVAVLSVNEEEFDRKVLALVRQFTGERHKISIKAPDGSTSKYAPLKHALESLGHKVRIDSPANWRCRQKLRDDVVLWGTMTEDSAAQEGSVNIALFKVGDAQSALFDGYIDLPREQSECAYDDVLASIEDCVSERLQVPIDQPLIDRSDRAGSDPMAGWLEKQDPVREWLDM